MIENKRQARRGQKKRKGRNQRRKKRGRRGKRTAHMQKKCGEKIKRGGRIRTQQKSRSKATIAVQTNREKRI